MDQHFYNGFIKRAQDYGLSVVEADSLVKQAIVSDPSVMRVLIPQLMGAASGAALGGSQGHPLMGVALGQLLGMAVGIPWGLHHLKQRSKKQYKDKNTNKTDREALEHYYPEFKENVKKADSLVKVAYDNELPHGWWRAITIPITAALLLNRYLASRHNEEEVTKKKENVKKANHQQLFDHLSTNTQVGKPSYPTPSRSVHSNWPEGLTAPDGSWSTPMSAAPKDVAKKYNFSTNPVPFSGSTLNDDIQNSYGRMDHVRNTGSATGFAPINSAYDPRYIDKARKLNAGMAAQSGIPYDSRIK